VTINTNHPGGQNVYLDWDRVRVFDKEVAQMFLSMIKAAQPARYGTVIYSYGGIEF
jgi:DNA topoisomerase-3